MQTPIHTRPRLADVLTDVSIREGSQQQVDLRGRPVAEKLALLECIVHTGVRHIELTAFAPGAWFGDAHDLTRRAAVFVPRHIHLRALYFNTRGLEELLAHTRLVREGIFHTAATSTYRLKNYRQRSAAHALEKLNRMLDAFHSHGLGFDRLVLSTAWGEPGEDLAVQQVLSYLERVMNTAAGQGFPVASITLADTVGNAEAEAVAALIDAVKTAWPLLQVGVHLHPRPGGAEDCVHAALEGGADRWEAAWGGLGGSPYASDAGGNLDIRTLAAVYRKRGLDTGLKSEAAAAVIDFIRSHTLRNPVDL